MNTHVNSIQLNTLLQSYYVIFDEFFSQF